MTYKGYTAVLGCDNGVYSGEVAGIKDVVTFQGATVEEAEQAFHDSVDDYLEFCKERGEEPCRTRST